MLLKLIFTFSIILSSTAFANNTDENYVVTTPEKDFVIMQIQGKLAEQFSSTLPDTKSELATAFSSAKVWCGLNEKSEKICQFVFKKQIEN